MLVFLYGSDRFRLMRESLSLRERFLRENPDADRRVVDVEDEDFSVSKLSELIANGGLFSKKRFVVISSLFSLEKTLRDDIECFFSKTYRNNSDVYVIIREPNVDKRSRLFKTLKKIADSSEEFLLLEGIALRRWAQEYLQETFPKSVWEEGAVGELLLHTQNNLSRFACECEKVFLFAKNQHAISQQDVKKASLSSETISPFLLLDAFASGSSKEAIEEVRKRLETGDDPYAILGILAYHIRTVLAILSYCEEKGICDARTIARSEKLPPFVVERVLRNRSKIHLVRAKKMMRLLGRMDLATKKGSLDPEFALEEFLLRG